MAEAIRYRSPLAYIGATALVCLTVGAVATAVYFYNEANRAETAPVVAEAPLGADTVIAPVDPPAVPPGFDTGGGRRHARRRRARLSARRPRTRAAADRVPAEPADRSRSFPETVVRPAEVPDSRAAEGRPRLRRDLRRLRDRREEGDRVLRRTATPKLARELSQDPPRCRPTARCRRRRVLNVVAGKKDGKTDGGQRLADALRRDQRTAARADPPEGQGAGWSARSGADGPLPDSPGDHLGRRDAGHRARRAGQRQPPDQRRARRRPRRSPAPAA